jgi:hypothetical protein
MRIKMSFFKKIDGEGAICVEKGVYKQTEVYERDGFIYIKAAGGFVRVMADGSTSKLGGSLKLDFMTMPDSIRLAKSRYGYLCTAEVPDSKLLDKPATAKLLGAPE